MKTLSALTACALLALASPAVAQNPEGGSGGRSLPQNDTSNGATGLHSKQGEAAGAQSGPSTVEGRSSASDTLLNNGKSYNPGPGTPQQRDVK